MHYEPYSTKDILKVLIFSILGLPLILLLFFDVFSAVNVIPNEEKKKEKRRKPEPPPLEPSEEEVFVDEYSEPETDEKLIQEVISGLQNLGFKKRDATISVLNACKGKVFEDHQSLVEAAMDKSNL